MTFPHSLADKWDQRYAARSEAGEPAAVLLHNAHLLPSTGNVLDLACGLGANARWLAQRGLQCEGWDISTVALDALSQWRGPRGEQVQTCLHDVEASPPEPASFDVIVVSDFLHRPLCPAIALALRPGGLLFYQTWAADKPTSIGPSNPDFLLKPNELLQLFAGLEVRVYQHTQPHRAQQHIDATGSGATVQGGHHRIQLVAQQPAHR